MPRKSLESGIDYPQDRNPTLNETGDGLDHSGIEVVQTFDAKDVDLEKFMAEKVVIRIAKKNTDSKWDLVSPSVNGRIQHLIRGYDQECARKYVEVLVRSHETTYAYEDGDDGFLTPGKLPDAQTTPIHSVELVRDSAQGFAWFEALKREQQE